MITCNKCGIAKEETEFYKHKVTRNNKTWVGYRKTCKECYAEESKKRKNERYVSKTIEYDRERIIEARKAKGLSRGKMSLMTGIPFYTYVSIETKANRTSKERLSKIYEVLGLE